jgi:hypothetical protein
MCVERGLTTGLGRLIVTRFFEPEGVHPLEETDVRV